MLSINASWKSFVATPFVFVFLELFIERLPIFFLPSFSNKQSNNIIQTDDKNSIQFHARLSVYNKFSRKHGREGAGIKSCHVVRGDYSPAAQHRVNCSLITLYRVSPYRVHHTRVPRSLRYSAIIFDKRRPVGSMVPERRNNRRRISRWI